MWLSYDGYSRNRECGAVSMNVFAVEIGFQEERVAAATVVDAIKYAIENVDKYSAATHRVSAGPESSIIVKANGSGVFFRVLGEDGEAIIQANTIRETLDLAERYGIRGVTSVRAHETPIKIVLPEGEV